MKILVCEDDVGLNMVLKKRLVAHGYSVETVKNGIEALDVMKVEDFDLVISDVMMPEMDGLQFLKIVRDSKKDVPILFLSAKDKCEDIVKGLDMGADDYIVKPFEFAELLARIRLLTRRKFGSRDNIYIVADLEVNCNERTVKRSGIEICLSYKEFELLQLLVKNKNIVLSREKIANTLYEWDSYVESNAIDVFIRYLRKKVDEGFDKKLIQTVRGVGYVVKEQ